jgi:hypothetical protein
MRLTSFVPALLILALSAPASAAEWIEYINLQDRFIVNVPTQPVVTDITYPTEFGINLPARVHTSVDGQSRYSVTAVDYSNIQKLHADRVKACAGAYPDTCTNQGGAELRGALDYAISTYLKRGGQVTYYAYANSDRVEGRRLQITNADQSRTFVAVYLHENRIYILDGTVPKGAVPPALFQQSMGFYDKDGVRVRYETIYSNFYPAPKREPGSGRFQGC